MYLKEKKIAQWGWQGLCKRIIVLLYKEKDSVFFNKTRVMSEINFTKVGNVAYVYGDE
jgi:hypothetical protein